MLRRAVTLVILTMVASSAAGVTKQGCIAEGGTVEPSARGASWWRCCLKVPSGILRNDKTQICFVCDGDSPQGNCDQIPYAGKAAIKLDEKPVAKDAKKTK